ncbi:prenyltransferase/squalene oxidase repeat-containing protein [Amycolatopsis sp. NPDC059090]|uniref:prenyltransferase/squalene oxidase repeat-containing protein n=1 Tax=Amycolatopsis sp. NPDC059090 TaxID=3346723 RepID=UPI00366AC839
MSADGPSAVAVDASIAAAAAALFSEQRPDGSWEGFVPSSPTATASVIIAFRAADPDGSHDFVDRAVDWMAGVQNLDGGWGDVSGGPSTVNATAIGLAAVTMARPRAETVISKARSGLARLGGQDAVADKERATLNPAVQIASMLAGLFDPERVMRIPVEIALLPERMQRRISFGRPGIYAIALMQSRGRQAGRPRRWLSALAERRVLRYLRKLREFEGADGGCEESCLAVAFIVVALALAGVGDDIKEQYLGYLARSVRADGSWPIVRDLEMSGTCQAIGGLWEAGFGDDERLGPAVTWIKVCQRDIALPAAGAMRGGWGWSLPSSWPDVEDTALALLTLRRLGVSAADKHVGGGVAWLRAMQNRNGSWGCFVRSNRSSFDAPCSAFTAHSMMALREVPGSGRQLDRAVRWLSRVQRSDGAMSSVWYRDLTSGTAQVLEAFGELGLGDHPVAQGCLRWLVDHQSPEGGWGDGCGGSASAEETSWALLSLVSAGHSHHPAAGAAANWLVSMQRADGKWDPSDALYYVDGVTYWCSAVVNGFALQALARHSAATR